MKAFVLGLAFALAVPVAAHAAEPEKKECCCEKDEHGKMKCCDEMKHGKPTESGKDPHAGHNMPEKKN